MTPRLSFAIMSVPARAAHVAAMVTRLRAQIAEARAAGVEVDDDVGVFEDTARRGPWHGWQGAWRCSPTSSTHHVVLQDDVQLCADLPATMAALAAARPDDVVSGFLPRQSIERAHAQGLRWVSTRRFLWAQCVMLPRGLGDAALAWIAEHEHEAAARGWSHHDDVRLAAFLAEIKRPVYVAVPNVVEHVGDALGGSTLGHNGPAAKRRARRWIGATERGAALGWDDLRCVRE